MKSLVIFILGAAAFIIVTFWPWMLVYALGRFLFG